MTYSDIWCFLLFQVGLIALSPYDQQAKIKIYRDASLAPANAASMEAPCKGDALVCYNAEESVKLAVDVLSGGFLRPTHQVTVTRADFTSADANNNNGGEGHHPSAAGNNKPHQAYKPNLSQAQVKVAKSAIKQALTWNEDDDIGKRVFDCIVIAIITIVVIPVPIVIVILWHL